MSATPQPALRWLGLLAVLLCSHSWAATQKVETPLRHHGHERWKALDAKERAEMRDRYRAWRDLKPESRERRMQRAQRLRELIEEVYQGMQPEWRARLDRMEPHERHRYLARLAVEEARKRSREVSLVQDRMERSEGLRRDPHGRGRDFHKRVMDSVQAYVAQHGLPAGLGQEAWQAMLQLEGREQGRALRRLVGEYPELRKALPRPRWKRKLDPRQHVLHKSLRLRPEAHWQVLRAPEEQREALEWNLRREQLLRGMQDHPEAFPAEEVERVRGMDAAALRAWIRETGMRHGSGFHRGPRGERGGPPPRGGPERGHPKGKPGDPSPGRGRGPGARRPRSKDASLSPPPPGHRGPRNKDRNDQDAR